MAGIEAIPKRSYSTVEGAVEGAAPTEGTDDSASDVTLTDVSPALAAQRRRYGGAESSNPGDIVYGTAMGIAAPGGVGKTTLLGTLAHPFDPDTMSWQLDVLRPNTSPLLVWDDNSNSHMLPYSDMVDVVRLEDFGGTVIIDRTLNELERGDHTHLRSIAWDNVTASYDRKFQEVGRSPQGTKNPDQRSWYNLTNQWITITTRRLLNLAQGPRQINVFFIFQEVQEERVVTDPNSGSFINQRRKEPSLSNKMQGYWPSMVPFLGFLYTASDTIDPAPRVLDFRALSYSMGKKQAPLEARLNLIPGMVWNPDLGHLVSVLHGLEEWDVAKHTRVIKKQSYAVPQEDEKEEATE